MISKEERNIDFLKGIVTKIVGAVADTANIVNMHFPLNMTKINREVKFVTTQELEDLYPDKTPSEREQIVTREYRTVCIMQIGGKLKSGVKHDGRAPDYDDWSLNGDIFFWLDSIYNFLGSTFYLNGACGVKVIYDNFSIDACMLVEKPDYSNLPPTGLNCLSTKPL